MDVTSKEAKLARSDRRDLWTTIIVAALTAVAAIVVAVQRLLELFSADGIAISMPIDHLPGELALGTEGATIAATITQATVLVPGINSVSLVMLVAVIVAQSLTVLALVACALLLCRNLMHGTAFSRTNTRLVFTASIVVLAGALVSHAGTTMGLNGAFAALADEPAFSGVEFTSSGALFASFWPAYLAAIALGAIAIAFRRGESLQRDTEGLV